MENKEPIKIFVSPNKKAWQHFLPGVAEKLNQLQSVQGYEKQITHKNICKSPQKRKKVLPWQKYL